MNKMLLAAAVATVGVVGLAGVNAVSAQTSDQSFASRIAERFNLDSSEVQDFIESEKTDRQEARQEAKAEHLEGLVTEGVITQAQLDALETKVAELREAKEDLKDSDLSREEIRSAMEEAREEFETWAEEQGIDLDEIRPERSEHKRGHKGHGPRESQDTNADTLDTADVEAS